MKIGFIHIPHPMLQGVDDKEKQLVEHYRCVLPNSNVLEVMSGFVFDGASIPRLFWTLVGSPFTGRYQRAAFIHDVLYTAELYSRRECDSIMLDIMQEHGCWWITRNLIWAAVRSFGFFVWNRHTNDQIKKGRQYVKLYKPQ